MKKPRKSPYEVLGVPTDASDAEVKRAYRKRARKAHPDKGGDHEEMADINRAWECLSDPERRRLYDQTGDDEQRPFDEEMVAVILQSFADAISNNAPDPLAFAKRQISTARANIEIQKHEALAARSKLEKKREKISVKTGDNLFHLLIDKELHVIDGKVFTFEHRMEVCRVALETLKNYEFHGDFEFSASFTLGAPSAFYKPGV